MEDFVKRNTMIKNRVTSKPMVLDDSGEVIKTPDDYTDDESSMMAPADDMPAATEDDTLEESAAEQGVDLPEPPNADGGDDTPAEGPTEGGEQVVDSNVSEDGTMTETIKFNRVNSPQIKVVSNGVTTRVITTKRK